MEKELEERISGFLSVTRGHGYGDCYCQIFEVCGYGSCDGKGGRDDMESPWDGCCISSCGYGYGLSPGRGNANGDGDDYIAVSWLNNNDINSFNGKKVYHIDDIPMLIESVHDNYAKGYIIHSDFTLEPCYVAKAENCFAHGKTLREAFEDVTEKAMQGKTVEERVEEFLKEFKDDDKKVPAKELYKWHGFLTGSCRAGRNAFLRDHNIDIDNDEFTIKEFIDLTKNEYGSEAIKELEKNMTQHLKKR